MALAAVAAEVLVLVVDEVAAVPVPDVVVVDVLAPVVVEEAEATRVCVPVEVVVALLLLHLSSFGSQVLVVTLTKVPGPDLQWPPPGPPQVLVSVCVTGPPLADPVTLALPHR